MLRKYNPMLLGSMLIVVSLLSCGGKKGGGDKKGGEVEKTKLSYTINLDDSKKIKEEGNKFYYEVPVNTEVIITATVTGSENVQVTWDQVMKKLSGTMPVSQGTFWKYKPSKPSVIEVSGKPSATRNVNGIDLIVNEGKTFVITWK